VLIQRAITASLINRYGDNAVDHGAAFLHSGFVVTMGLVGGFFGILYMTACRRLPWLARAGGLMFASLFTFVLQPLLAAGLDYFSAVVSITQSLPGPSAFAKTGSFPQDLAPPLLLGIVMAALLFLMGLTMNGFAQLGMRWLSRLPRAVHASLTSDFAAIDQSSLDQVVSGTLSPACNPSHHDRRRAGVARRYPFSALASVVRMVEYRRPWMLRAPGGRIYLH
jgi:hypothetical protein